MENVRAVKAVHKHVQLAVEEHVPKPVHKAVAITVQKPVVLTVQEIVEVAAVNQHVAPVQQDAMGHVAVVVTMAVF